jgi:phosphatidylglycerophosphate synthase
VRTFRQETVLGTLVPPALLGVLALTGGLGAAGWVVGLAAGWTTTALLVVSRIRDGATTVPPADWITLTRALLAAGVAALVADSFDRPPRTTALVVLATVALVLDAVDGQVARRTGTANPLGARFDGEVDAWLILVLSVAVARDYGGWVLAIGAARYALLVAGWALPWLAAPLPPRYWGKVVAAVTGIALTVAISGLVPPAIGMAVVGVAMLLIVESFGRAVGWLYRSGAGERTRRVVRTLTAVGAAAVVWAVLVAPTRLDRLTSAAFARVPIEGLVLVAVGLLLPARPRRVLAAVAGVLIGLLALVEVLDLGFNEELGRPFDPVLDWGNLGPAIGVVRDSIGSVATDVVLVLLVVAIVVVLGLVTVATVRITSVAARHRRRTVGGIAVLGLVWALSAALSLQLVPGAPVASASAAGLVTQHVRSTEATVRDQHRFDSTVDASDPYSEIPAENLLTGLRGKDVVVAFVESYGQVAVQGTTFSSGVDAVLRSGTTQLADAGFSARSGFLTSPTFGGISWLAHSTLQSGLWIDNQQRYDQLVASQRFTLSDAFGKAGWRTIVDIPSDDSRPWPQGQTFYHYDKVYNRYDVGYRGPKFGYAPVPDQYTLAAFQRMELTPGHQPLMAEIDLVSSHTPWTPLPHLVPWDQLGDGSVYDPMPAQGLTTAVAWQNPATVQQLYGQSIQYSVQSLIDWVTRMRDPNLVLVMLGDHQPSRTVSGADANHQVPISFVTSDTSVLDRISSWHWQDGLLPGPDAPLWPMDAFRDRFFDAYGGAPADAPADSPAESPADAPAAAPR